MAILRGVDAIAGVGSETSGAPNTEVAVTQKLRLISETWNPQYQPIEQEALLGAAARARSDQGILVVAGQLVTDWTYDTNDILLRKFFGTYTTSIGSADDFYTFDDTLDDLTASLAFHKQVGIWAFTGCKFSQLQISGAPGQPLRLTLDGFGMNFSLASTTNTTAVLDALSEPSSRVLFHHLTDAFLLGDHADSLTTADNHKINTFALTLNRGMTQFHTQSQAPEQARENAHVAAQLQFTLPLYDTNQFRTWHASHTALQLEVTALKTGTADTRKRLRFPMCFVANDPVPVSGAGLAAHTVTLNLYHDLAGENLTTEFDFSEVVRLYEQAT